jgi:hypothetical protein
MVLMADIGAYKTRGDAVCPVCDHVVVTHDGVIDRHDCAVLAALREPTRAADAYDAARQAEDEKGT